MFALNSSGGWGDKTSSFPFQTQSLYGSEAFNGSVGLSLRPKRVPGREVQPNLIRRDYAKSTRPCLGFTGVVTRLVSKGALPLQALVLMDRTCLCIHPMR